MIELIRALQYFWMIDANATTQCEPNLLIVHGDFSDMTDIEKDELLKLGFSPNSDVDGWSSTKWGSD